MPLLLPLLLNAKGPTRLATRGIVGKGEPLNLSPRPPLLDFPVSRQQLGLGSLLSLTRFSVSREPCLGSLLLLKSYAIPVSLSPALMHVLSKSK